MKRTLAFDSQHRIGVSTISRELLTVDQSVCRWNFKNCDLRNVFASVLATSRDMAKRTPPFDSAHKIGVSTFSREVLTVHQGVCR